MAFPSKGRVETLGGVEFDSVEFVDGVEFNAVVTTAEAEVVEIIEEEEAAVIGMTAIELSAVSAVVARTFTVLPMPPIWIWRGGVPFLFAVAAAGARLNRASLLATIVLLLLLLRRLPSLLPELPSGTLERAKRKPA
jgi:hypothetical protein